MQSISTSVPDGVLSMWDGGAPVVHRHLVKPVKCTDLVADILASDVPLVQSHGVEELSHKPTVKTFTNLEEYLQHGTGYCKQQSVPDAVQQDLESTLGLHGRVTTPYMWLCREGLAAKTGLHNDDEWNILVQLSGKKRVLLFAPRHKDKLYLNDKFDVGTECCDADPLVEDWATRWPLLKAVPEVLHAELDMGDVLAFPPFWYHTVQVIPQEVVNVSVNIFHSAVSEWLLHEPWRCLQTFAHSRLKLYKWGHCVCHTSSTQAGGQF
mmetsp:Transcript_47087/g.86331  ORF Transcript_47087/g.86331 Transcript_47087/m.86331 type:complete len:266 (-) Transcript_47087:20-817(-)